ncbi:MAG TPA: hypothetical protein VIN75_03920 [Burkholderiaceae bacterium]
MPPVPQEASSPRDRENPSAHDPALARDHDAGPDRERLSPSERALAPEGDAPMQSHNAVADDGTYVGQAGGYMGGASPAVESGRAQVNEANRRGDGAYGFPAGPGVGMPGGEHQPAAQKPDDLPNQYPQR